MERLPSSRDPSQISGENPPVDSSSTGHTQSDNQANLMSSTSRPPKLESGGFFHTTVINLKGGNAKSVNHAVYLGVRELFLKSPAAADAPPLTPLATLPPSATHAERMDLENQLSEEIAPPVPPLPEQAPPIPDLPPLTEAAPPLPEQAPPIPDLPPLTEEAPPLPPMPADLSALSSDLPTRAEQVKNLFRPNPEQGHVRINTQGSNTLGPNKSAIRAGSQEKPVQQWVRQGYYNKYHRGGARPNADFFQFLESFKEQMPERLKSRLNELSPNMEYGIKERGKRRLVGDIEKWAMNNLRKNREWQPGSNLPKWVNKSDSRAEGAFGPNKDEIGILPALDTSQNLQPTAEQIQETTDKINSRWGQTRRILQALKSNPAVLDEKPFADRIGADGAFGLQQADFDRLKELLETTNQELIDGDLENPPNDAFASDPAAAQSYREKMALMDELMGLMSKFGEDIVHQGG